MSTSRSKTVNFFALSVSALIAVYLVVKMFYAAANVVSFSVALNIPNEVRDLVQYRIAHAFMSGTNPYSLEALTSGNVPLVYMYTFLQPLCVAVICRLTGMGIIAGNFTVNIFCVLGTALCIWLIVKDIFTYGGGGIMFFLLSSSSQELFSQCPA